MHIVNKQLGSEEKLACGWLLLSLSLITLLLEDT